MLRWLLPPVPSVKHDHNIACKAHHCGTAQCLFQGSIFNEWNEKHQRTKYEYLVTRFPSPAGPCVEFVDSNTGFRLVGKKFCNEKELSDRRNYIGLLPYNEIPVFVLRRYILEPTSKLLLYRLGTILGQ